MNFREALTNDIGKLDSLISRLKEADGKIDEEIGAGWERGLWARASVFFVNGSFVIYDPEDFHSEREFDIFNVITRSLDSKADIEGHADELENIARRLRRRASRMIAKAGPK